MVAPVVGVVEHVGEERISVGVTVQGSVRRAVDVAEKTSCS